jgi:formylglycine-generating enzyme required for sulfatase activity
MVGNVDEWVADWGDMTANCTDWTTSAGIPGGDLSCVGGPGGVGVNSLPSALFRGGSFLDGTYAGVFAVVAGFPPSRSGGFLGFRCAR